MVDFGKSIENYETLFDSPWKMPDWAYMKDHVIPKAQEFQQLVEVQESARILVDIANGNKHSGSYIQQPH